MTSHDGWFLRHFVKLRLILQRRWILIIVATLVVRREEMNILCKKNFNKSSILRIGLATVMKNNVIMGDTQTDRPTLARPFKRLFLHVQRGQILFDWKKDTFSFLFLINKFQIFCTNTKIRLKLQIHQPIMMLYWTYLQTSFSI